MERKGKILLFIVVILLGILAAMSMADENARLQTISQLKSSDAHDRAAAACVLAKQVKSPEADKAMADQLSKEKDPEVRRALYENAGRSGGKETAKALTDRIKAEKDKGIRPIAIFSLGQTQDEGAVATLRTIFLDEKEDLNARLNAANGLTCIATDASVRALEEGIKDKNPAIRLQAAASLAGYCSPVLVQERVNVIKKQAKEDADENNRKYIKEYILKRKFNLKE